MSITQCIGKFLRDEIIKAEQYYNASKTTIGDSLQDIDELNRTDFIRNWITGFVCI